MTLYFFIRKRSIASVRQRRFVVGVEAWVVLQRAGLAEVYALEYRVGRGRRGQDKLDLGVLAFEADIKFTVLIRVVERAAAYLDRSLQLGDFGRQFGLDGHRALRQVGADAEEVLVPDAQLFGVAPRLQERARTACPRLSFARMGIGILAEAAHGAFVQGLAVHVLEEFPRRLLLAVLNHALHGDAVVPQPDGTVVVGVVLVVVVPVLVLRVELRVPLRQRGDTPRIDQLFPNAAGDALLEVVVGYQLEAVELVGAVLQVGRAVGVQVVVDEEVSLLQ